MQTIVRDILTVETGFIIHQVNCRGVMGSGLAKQIRAKWPEVYDCYISYLKHTHYPLGTHQPVLVKVDEGIELSIVNLFGQQDYGTDKRYTSYEGLAAALASFALSRSKIASWKRRPVYVPYKLGCGRGGGDWEIVEDIIEALIPDAIVCMPPKGI